LGIFLARDPWEGDALHPITFNGYVYVNQNPVLLTDPSGKCPICWILILLGLAACSSPGDSCPALTGNLPPGPFGKLPRAEALVEVQKLHNIQLPPGFQFEYDPSKPLGITGLTHWFDDPKFGKISIYEVAFTAYAPLNPDYGSVSSAYDIEAIMVHEAVHAWQIYTMMNLAEDSKSGFKQANTGNPYQPSYTEGDWYGKYKKVFEWQAWDYVENHEPPLCPSQEQKENIKNLKRDNYGPPYPLIPGLNSDRLLSLVGYPLP
jgi:hypothetical protein